MPTIRGSYADQADRASREQMSYRGFLAELLLAECDDRARRRSERLVKAATFPRDKSLRAFDFDANPNIDPAVIHTLAKCEWVAKGQPLCLIGDSGTGKAHLLIALATEAAWRGLPDHLVGGTDRCQGKLPQEEDPGNKGDESKGNQSDKSLVRT